MSRITETQLLHDMIDGFALHEVICDMGGQPVDYLYLNVNPAFEELTGLQAMDVVGKTVREVLPNLSKPWIEPFGKVALSGEKAHFEHFSSELGLHLEVKVYRPAPGQVACFFIDISERIRDKEELRKSEENYRLLVENQNELVVKVDAEGRFLFVSPTYCKTFGKSEEDLLGNSFMPLVHEEDQASTAKAMENLLQPPHTANVEQRALTVAGWRWLSWSDRAIVDDKGRIEAIVGVGRDITLRKKIEEALEISKQRAEEANRAKSIFLANMSHEIRTPMIGILGFSEMLGRTELTDKQKEYLTTICSSGDNMLSLIDGILDITRLEAGKLSISSENFSLRDCLTDLEEGLRPRLLDKGLSLKTDIMSDLPDKLSGDQLRVKQILLNLLDNGIKFTQKGTISIAVSVVERSDTRVLLDISVKDTGCGIPENAQGLIFEQFGQTDVTTKNHLGGVGLGLTICRQLTHLMGGSLHVESLESSGSTFLLRLPLSVATDSIEKSEPPEVSPPRWEGPTLRILLAEDNPISIEYTRSLLQTMGHEVTVVENGKAALDTLKAHAFELVLMDVQMPEMSGDRALSLLRERETQSGEHMPVIALTAYALTGDKEKYLKMGFDGYLSKPFTTRELVCSLDVLDS